ncbi:aspartate-semialdehyde dehydrogenase [Candidatus Riesia pediculicola]|uniref:Aspartate-semialdehyde dehydrogenase n=1 Tax=Riesia pediculicola (strain USDA) TaxID=515618 RepID=D4G7W0_RIEPU|nr:aspartate-semialdehyde dehydrogenase [Candidatus Riesia pediculicola]ADD79599.1 aspartate-semialdehyde dehydrogenase [Candidatus Riesia pediculicola USDA]ARC53677.1 aspartate-semialdehyde dehydrogenase [Candidatus Riesia pediculicola]QOJ86322.1 aspartate-semialdehyde dehydrogenase [Candidatus Riesia pediculicola]
MYNVGFIGWRGMVGSVLLKRMREQGDFKSINPFFLSTSQFGKERSVIYEQKTKKILDAFDLDVLSSLDIIVCCAGNYYTNQMYFKLKKTHWKGYWLDSASSIRRLEESLIVLDPINKKKIYQSLESGVKTFVSGNCVVNLMLMSLIELFRKNLIEWISVSTYQSVSGAGSNAILRLIEQIEEISKEFYKSYLSKSNLKKSIEKEFLSYIQKYSKEKELSLVVNTIPWIGKENILYDGRTSEEWKIQNEVNRILGLNKNNLISIDSTCVRVGSVRCHGQSFLIKLKRNISIQNIQEILKKNHEWINIVPNEKKETLKKLTQSKVMGTLDINVGRIRKMKFGKKYISLFSVGDQLLWGSAEPLRRMLKILIKKKN